MTDQASTKTLSPGIAIALTCLFFMLYCFCDALAKYLQSDFSAHFILLAVNIIGLSCTHLYAFTKYKQNWRIIYQSNYLSRHLGRSAAAIITTWSVLFSVKQIALTEFYGLIFTTPFFAALLARIILKERVSALHWGLITLGFVGVLLIIAPMASESAQNISFNDKAALLGYGAGLLAAFSFAIGALCTKSIGKDVTQIPFVLYPQLGILAANIPFVLSEFLNVQTSAFTMSGFTAINLLIFLGYGFMLWWAIWLNGYAFSNAPSLSLVIPFQYTQIIWAVIIGALVFDERLTLLSFAGIGVIILSGLALRLSSDHSLKKQKP
jgi:drug/metabolite transporter (DMT)-like permease